ncbi:MAG: 2-hydroxyacyl-CoA dehydratase family protein [Syntrophales bacterium]
MEWFEEIMKDPIGYGRKLKADGRKVVGYFCSYMPEEIVLAAGAHPFRIFGAGGDMRLADSHLQSYCCSLVRGMLENALTGRLDFLDGVIIPHTCDSIQRLSDIWRLNVPGMFHLDLVLPVKLDTASAREYYQSVLKKLRSDLEGRLGVAVTDDSLRGAIRVSNDVRRIIGRLYGIMEKTPGVISGREIWAAASASMIADRNEAVAELSKMLGKIEARSAPAMDGRKRILLSGGVCSYPEIYRIVEESGGVVAGDDFCTGSRYFAEKSDEEGDPLAAIAGRHLSRIICPAKFAGLSSRGLRLVRMAKEKKADGVIFVLLKFCDPHAFDYPYIKELLDREGIPNLLVEIEEQPPSEGQLRTRFETFMEMIQARKA